MPRPDDKLTPGEAAALYEELTGRELRRQRIQQLARRGDIEAEVVEVVITETLIPRREIERLAREGLPHRGKGGRPRKAPLRFHIGQRVITPHGPDIIESELWPGDPPGSLPPLYGFVRDGLVVQYRADELRPDISR